MVDPFQYGNTRAAINLVKILEELGNSRYKQKVSRFLCKNNETIKAIASIKSPYERDKLFMMFRVHLMQQDLRIPEDIRQHTLNVLITRIRANSNWKSTKRAVWKLGLAVVASRNPEDTQEL